MHIREFMIHSLSVYKAGRSIRPLIVSITGAPYTEHWSVHFWNDQRRALILQMYPLLHAHESLFALPWVSIMAIAWPMTHGP